MKKILKHKKLILLLIAVLVPTGFAIAGMVKTVPMTAIVTNGDVQVFSDSDCTIPLDSIALGEISAGSTSSKTVYVKNAGNRRINVNVSLSGAPTHFTLQPVSQMSVDGGGSVLVTLTFAAAIDSPAGTISGFDVVFTGTIP